jgi:hypothetical protein
MKKSGGGLFGGCVQDFGHPHPVHSIGLIALNRTTTDDVEDFYPAQRMSRCAPAFIMLANL